MEVIVICSYCGFKEVVKVEDSRDLVNKTCSHCNDPNLTFKEAPPKKDYY